MVPALDENNLAEKLPDTFKVRLSLDLCSNKHMYTLNPVMFHFLFPLHLMYIGSSGGVPSKTTRI